LCGIHFQNNPEKYKSDILILHTGLESAFLDFDTRKSNDYDYVKGFLEPLNIEGMVFHEVDGNRYCKIRKVDFGLERS